MKVERGYKLGRALLSILVLAAIVMPVCSAEMGTGKEPQIAITEPKEGAQIPSDMVTVMVNVTNFKLVNKLGAASVPGEGHIHYFMDVAIPTAPGKPALTAVGTYLPTINTSFTWMDVKPGKHNFSVELVNNNHTPLVPPAVAMVNITVTGMASNATAPKMDAKSVVIGVTAKNIAFNVSTITVPAGANVTVIFDNQDAGISHNIAFYDSEAAEKLFYRGEIFQGIRTVTYHFTGPSAPGTYWFRCDVHPTAMYGKFIVT